MLETKLQQNKWWLVGLVVIGVSAFVIGNSLSTKVNTSLSTSSAGSCENSFYGTLAYCRRAFGPTDPGKGRCIDYAETGYFACLDNQEFGLY